MISLLQLRQDGILFRHVYFPLQPKREVRFSRDHERGVSMLRSKRHSCRMAPEVLQAHGALYDSMNLGKNGDRKVFVSKSCTRQTLSSSNAVGRNTPGVVDGENNRLRHAVQRGLFQMVPLYGIFHSDSANVVTGSVISDGSVQRKTGTGEPLPTSGEASDTPRHPVTIDKLRRAVDLVAAWDEVESDRGSRYRRFCRGLGVLFEGFHERVANERLRTGSLLARVEALVLPEVGATQETVRPPVPNVL